MSLAPNLGAAGWQVTPQAPAEFLVRKRKIVGSMRHEGSRSMRAGSTKNGGGMGGDMAAIQAVLEEAGLAVKP